MEIYTGYLAVHKFESELERELELKKLTIAHKRDRLYLIEGNHPPMIWAQMSAFNLQKIDITSINDGARKLKALGRNWGLFTTGNHRRAQLIQDELPKLSQKPVEFRQKLPNTPMGFWTLWSPNEILATTETSSPFPLGEMTFA
jgi:23S rRNA (cytidine2498-2'-O)-methyltransferase